MRSRLTHWVEEVRHAHLVKTTRAGVRQAQQKHLPFLAAGLAYYGMLALVPGLIALVSIYGLVAEPADVSTLVADISDAAPAEVVSFIEGQLDTIVTADAGGLGVSAAISILGALWAASAGMRSLIRGVNIAFGVDEIRPGLRLRLMAVGITLGVVVFFGVVAVLGSFGGGFLGWARFPIIVLTTVGGLALLYRTAPSARTPAWSSSWFGAGVATVGWLAASTALGYYLASFGSFNETYGTLGAVMATLLWLFLSAYVILIGAVVNAIIDAQRAVP